MATLKLNSAKTKMLSGFVDSYLKLSEQEERAFQSQIERINSEEKEKIMAITTSWKEEGIKEGIEQGRKLELIESIREILQFKSISATDALELKINDLKISQLKQLRKASLGFNNLDELQQWLENS